MDQASVFARQEINIRKKKLEDEEEAERERIRIESLDLNQFDEQAV
jgi:stress response protein YsnF